MDPPQQLRPPKKSEKKNETKKISFARQRILESKFKILTSQPCLNPWKIVNEGNGCPEIDGSEGRGDNEFCKGSVGVFPPYACTEKCENNYSGLVVSIP